MRSGGNMGRYCVIGAGAAGLSALQAMKGTDHEVECFEKDKRIGGHWNTDYDALHLITARDQTHFPNFPMPSNYPHFPSRQQVLDYINAFADHEELRDMITFDTEVVSVSPVPTNEDHPKGSAGWKVISSRGDEGVFDGVLVANGHLWDAKVPTQAEDYEGLQLHSSEYQNTDGLNDGRVLVVGSGNSGCDMAVDVAQHRIPVDIVIRKGIHFQPKMYFGVPRQELKFLAEYTPQEQDLISRLLAKVSIGDNSAYPGMPQPESHDLAGGSTTVNDQLLYWIQHGRIDVKPAINQIRGKTVHFEDGTSQIYESILWATGFHASLPFLDSDIITWQNGTPVRYAGGMLPEGVENLYFVGLIAPRGPQIPVYGQQMRYILRMIALKEQNRPDTRRLTEFFGRSQQPETKIDVVRDDWNKDMADTDAKLAWLETMAT